jgi:hypothetical protein
MKHPMLQSAGKPREISEVKVIAFYAAETGNIVYMHTVVTLKGGRRTNDQDAIQQAHHQASRAGVQIAHLPTKVSTNPEHAARPHRIDLTSGEFVPLSSPKLGGQHPSK